MPLSVVAPLGPNPAALTELIWHLVGVEGHSVDAVWVVVESAKALGHLHTEILAPGRAWDDLRRRCGDGVPPGVHVVEAAGADGRLPADGHAPDLTDNLKEPLWRAARAAQRAAEVTVFALSGGRRRASTALQATTFQLLARRGDRLVDLRVSDPRAEGGSGFYFPRQSDADLVGVREHDGKPFFADAVEVIVDPIEVPRLRDLLADHELRSFAGAFTASEARILEAAPPHVILDLAKGRVLVDGLALTLSVARFVPYAALLLATARGERLWASDHDALRAVMDHGGGGGGWGGRVRVACLNTVKAGKPLDLDGQEALRGLHGNVGRSVRSWCAAHLPRAAHFLLPRSEKVGDEGGAHNERYLLLPTDRIKIVGVP